MPEKKFREDFLLDEDIMAFSVLYGKSRALFKLGVGYLEESFSRAIICDYKNSKEIWYDFEIAF